VASPGCDRFDPGGSPRTVKRLGAVAPSTVAAIANGPLTILENNMVTELKVNRRTKERRVRVDRRTQQDEHFNGQEKRQSERRKVERRRQIDPTTCERDYKPDEIEFMQAMDDYKRRSGRQFPTWSEVLEVLRDLGYRKVAAPTRTYE
jgi:hypothetical protein